MILIPGWLISLLTFPGIVVHEWAHKKFCNWLGVKVHHVVYFQLKNPAGFVSHEVPKTYKQVFWISVGPLIINSILTILLSFIISKYVTIIPNEWLYNTIIWLSFSVGMHAFPSDHDMQHISSASKSALKGGGIILHYLAFPFVTLVWISNKLRFIWFDAIYALLLISLGSGM